MAFDYLKDIGKLKEEVKASASTELGRIAATFAEDTIELMKDGAPKASGRLQASIAFNIQYEGDTFIIDFLADDYWDYLNSGVDGVEQSAGAITNRFGSTYSFKTLNPSRKMVDAFAGNGSMQNWLASKGITSLTYGGETHPLVTDADYRAAAYVLARGTKRHGIKPSKFVDNALAEDKLARMEQILLDKLAEIWQ